MFWKSSWTDNSIALQVVHWGRILGFGGFKCFGRVPAAVGVSLVRFNGGAIPSAVVVAERAEVCGERGLEARCASPTSA